MFNISVEKYDQVMKAWGAGKHTRQCIHATKNTQLQGDRYKYGHMEKIWLRLQTGENGSQGCQVLLLVGILGSVVIHGGEVHGGNECHWSVMTCLEKQEDKESHCLLSVYTAEC